MKILCLVGPTGTGKSRLGVALAQRFQGEIVNADSRQIYAELELGASKPSIAEQGGIPHHLFNSANLNDPWDVARFLKEAAATIHDIHSRARLPVVVGGTGLYVKVLLFGLFSGPQADPEIRRELEERIRLKGTNALHDELRSLDPTAARRIHPNDALRIIRALEVHRLTHQPISKAQAGHRFLNPRYDYLKIGLRPERGALYRGIEARVDAMVAQGLEAEARNLWERLGEHPLLIRSIGYREWLPYFQGRCFREEVIGRIKQNTRRLAKRQMTWFRKETEILWHAPEDLEGIGGNVERFLGRG